MVKVPTLPYDLLWVGERIVRFIPFLRVLPLCEMQTALSKIWTLVTKFISNEPNHCTMDASNHSCMSKQSYNTVPLSSLLRMSLRVRFDLLPSIKALVAQLVEQLLYIGSLLKIKRIESCLEFNHFWNLIFASNSNCLLTAILWQSE